MKTITQISNRILTSLLLLLAMGSFTLFAQSGMNVTADIRQGDAAYMAKKYVLAAGYYEKSIAKGDVLTPVYWTKLADCYWQTRSYDKCEKAYNHLLEKSGSSLSNTDRIRLAEISARTNQYKKAGEWLKGIPGFAQKAEAFMDAGKLAEMEKDSADWQMSLPDMNTAYREFAPLLYSNTLLFSSNRPYASKTRAFDWDGVNYSRLWQVDKNTLSTQPVSSLTGKQIADLSAIPTKSKEKRIAGIYEGADTKASSPALSVAFPRNYLQGSSFVGSLVEGLDNVPYNAGGVSIDKNNTIYFSANYDRSDANKINRIRLMQGSYDGKKITNITALPFGDSNQYSAMHPAVNPEGTLLVFSSDMPNGKGGYDLYVSKRNDSSQSWGEPQKLDVINTAGNEVFPSITDDGYLYYSSDGRPGLGGLDIYRIPMKDLFAGKDNSEHLSYPINSNTDDFGWTQGASASTGFFTSDRIGGNDNIFGFNYEKKIYSSLIEGYVKDKRTLQPISDVSVFVFDPKERKVYVLKTDANGKYSMEVKHPSDIIVKAVANPCNYAIEGVKQNCNCDCLAMQVVNPSKATMVQPAPRNLLLDKFAIGMKWKLEDIHYNFDKWNIRADARPILDSLVTIMKIYPINIELSAHTDCRGSYSYNDTLSDKRAKSTVEYIVSKGINQNRITAKGYGEHQLLNRCDNGVWCSEADHQLNRRTEIKVLSYSSDKETPGAFDPNKFKAGEQLDPSTLPANFFEQCK